VPRFDEDWDRYPWERLDGETNAAWQAFTLFLRSPTRKLLEISRLRGHKNSAQVSIWSKRYDWSERAAAWDLHQLGRIEAQKRANIVRYAVERERIELELVTELLADLHDAIRLPGELMRDPSQKGHVRLAAARQILDLLGIDDLSQYVERQADDSAEARREALADALSSALSGLDNDEARLVHTLIRKGLDAAAARQQTTH
jgi:hypothetical protein